MRFSGNNRWRDLQQLKRLYDEVFAAASDPSSEKATRIVLIEAERGLGKTRLATELYRHLSENSDPVGYWPPVPPGSEDGFTMPNAERCDYRKLMPFLWWGLEVKADASSGQTLYHSLPNLLSHLVAARIVKCRSDTRRNILAEAAEFAVELSLPVAEAAIDVSGMSPNIPRRRCACKKTARNSWHSSISLPSIGKASAPAIRLNRLSPRSGIAPSVQRAASHEMVCCT